MEKTYATYPFLSFTHAKTLEEAVALTQEAPIDLIIAIPSAQISAVFNMAEVLLEKKNTPFIILSMVPLSKKEEILLNNHPLITDYFYWMGDTDLLLSIALYMERKRHACKNKLLYIEDNPMDYSLYLPTILHHLPLHTHLIKVNNDEHALLALSNKEAPLVGIISDMEFTLHGNYSKQAWETIYQYRQKEFPLCPLLFVSNNPSNQALLHQTTVSFCKKNTPTTKDDIVQFLTNHPLSTTTSKPSYTSSTHFSLPTFGQGAVGGKARGIAFIAHCLKTSNHFVRYPQISIDIPLTLCISTDLFDEFIQANQLHTLLNNSNLSDAELLVAFTKAILPDTVRPILRSFLQKCAKPIAIRSSSVLEDSLNHSFAGIYATYMIPSQGENALFQLELAIKSVYASTFYAGATAYCLATNIVPYSEKMGLVIQEVCGEENPDRTFYPSLSGVAQSINYYPIYPEKFEDGLCKLALGLGKYIVDGEKAIRFSPSSPHHSSFLTTPNEVLQQTQKTYYALDLTPESFHPSTNELVNILRLPINQANKENGLKHIASTYDLQNNMVRDSLRYEGKRVITFNAILKHDSLPLAPLMADLLKLLAEEMQTPVELEFALQIYESKPSILHLLQVRPIHSYQEVAPITLPIEQTERTFMFSHHIMGHGAYPLIHHLILVKPTHYSPLNNTAIAARIAQLNAQFNTSNTPYMLIGPGRWGSSDNALGIPVKWEDISQARLLVELCLDNYRIDPSLGTHFFHHLIAMNIGYMYINPFDEDNLDWDKTALFTLEQEDEYVQHYSYKKGFSVVIDGKSQQGMVGI